MTTAFDASFPECVVASRAFVASSRAFVASSRAFVASSRAFVASSRAFVGRSRVSFSSVAESSGGFSVRRRPRACHRGCDHLRPGSLRASHAVCLASPTLEPVICARKEGADIECVSTTGNIFAESLVMRGDFFDIRTVPFGFYSTSRQGIPRRSPRNSNLDEVTANNGAAENCSARHGSCYSYSGVSRAVVALSHVRCLLLRSTFAATAPRSAVSELESLAVSSRTA